MKKGLRNFLIGCFGILVAAYACGINRENVPIFYGRDKPQKDGATSDLYPPVNRSPYIKGADFINGKLGIITPNMYTTHLLFAYYQLQGHKFSDATQKILNNFIDGTPQTKDDDLAYLKKWKKITGEKVVHGGKWITTKADGKQKTVFIEPLSNDAYRYAVERFEKLEKKFGSDHSVVKQWVSNQRKVFENCTHNTLILPEKYQESGLEKELDYQVASSHFYAGKFEKAAELFEVIAKNEQSEHKHIAYYLSFRSMCCNILVHDKDAAPFFDKLKKEAGAIKKSPYQKAISDLQTQVLYKTDRKLLLTQLIDKFLNNVDELTAQTMNDLYFVFLAANFDGIEHEFTKWVTMFRMSSTDAFAKWTETKNVLWLIVGLSAANQNTNKSILDQLISEAQKISVDDLAFESVMYYASVLQIKCGQKEDALKNIDQALNQKDLNLATKNKFMDLKASIAESVSDFFEAIVQTPVDLFVYSEMIRYQRIPFYHTETFGQDLEKDFDWEHVQTLKYFATNDLIKGSENANLPNWLKERILISAFLKAVLLKKIPLAKEAATKLTTLNEQHHSIFDEFISETDDARSHALGACLIASHPGFCLFIYPKSYRPESIDASKKLDLDGLNDNWWDNRLLEDENMDNLQYLGSDIRKSAQEEWLALKKAVSNRTEHLCRVALDWQKTHPKDPFIPEFLHWCVLMSKFDVAPKESKQVFVVLKNNYKGSLWEQKTKYHYYRN
ncbi:MAG: hypothetical protein WCJ92_02205 [Alphaproteobacteria bacterium]